VRVGVLALQGDVREHLAALTACGAEAVRVRRPSELAGLDGIVLPGGESTTIDKLVRAFGLQQPLRDRIAGGMPVYGSCAGMILLADRIADGRPDQETLGGLDMTVRRNAFGRQVDSFEEDLHIRELGGEPVRAVFIRAPWVEEAGESVQVLARVEHGPAAGRIVAARQGDLLVTSFHPEVTGDHRFHAYFVDIVRRRR
jgi:5'-phosphate synthase pdxT subunit